MIITAIQIRRLENTGTKMRGIATVTLDDMIAIHDIKILKNMDSMFLAMPSRTTKSNTFKDIVHPINSDVRAGFERLIIGGYNIACSKEQAYVELKVKNTQKQSLIEQDIDDFDVICLRTAEKQVITQTSHSISIELDEDLKKWLEG
ncbi:septation protein SpoVG family protein [Lachnospiraceae bacterium MD308]|nr:septation protein SpoVG family protein [Lachnospiraceae bacterium MD308]